MTVRDYITEDITIETATPEGDQWKIYAQVPSMNSKYAVGPLWKEIIDGELIKKGETVRCLLVRGDIKRPGSYEDKDYGYYWELAEWDTDKPVQSVSQGREVESPKPRSEIQRSKEEMRFTEAMHMAVSLFGNSIEKETPNFPLIQTWALELYEIIQQGTPEPAAQDAPVINGDEPEGESEATNPEAAINKSVRTWNHNNPKDALSIANLEQVLIEVYKISPAQYRDMVGQLTFDQAVEFGKHIADGDLDALITFGSQAAAGTEAEEDDELPF